MDISTAQTKFHQSNRSKLHKLLKRDNVELTVITGNSLIQSSGDRTFRFEQDQNFYYLTGINEPGVKLVLDGDQEYLIVPQRDKVRIAFEGEIDVERLSATSGIKKFIYKRWVGSY